MKYDFKHYNGSYITYPTKPVKPKMPMIIGRDGKPDTVLEYAEDLQSYVSDLREYEVALKIYNDEVASYHKLLGDLLVEFQSKLKMEFHLSDEEFDVIWSEAYERGHSYGLEEVYSYFQSLYEFVMRYMLAYLSQPEK